MDLIALRTDSATAFGDSVRAGLLRNARLEGVDDEAEQFETIDRACRRVGGLVQGDALALAMRKFRDQPISTLARWIVDRSVISFTWRGQTLLPRFQFDPLDMSPRADVRGITQALATTHTDWEVALWFAQTNPRLGGAAPLDVIERDPGAVLRAAQSAAMLAQS